MNTKASNMIDALVTKVRKLGLARPHTVYLSDAGCNYADGNCSDGTTGCLLGQALLELGYSAGQLRRLDEMPISSVAIVLEALLKTDNLPVDKVRWLRRVQDAQDVEVAWGEAVRAADQEVPL
jgi:hypothetical protein